MIPYYFNALLIALTGYLSPIKQVENLQKQASYLSAPVQTEKYQVKAEAQGKIRLINEKTGKPYVSAGDSVEMGQILFYLEFDNNSSGQITADRTGKLISINVKDGQAVKEGADVMTMDILVQTAEELFRERVRLAGMVYEAPAGFKPVDTRENPDMYYQWAIKHKKKKLEIRYFIYNLKQDLRAYEENKKGDGSVTMIDPNKLYRSFSLMNVLNTAAGDGGEMEEFPEEIVSTYFHADWGGGTGYTPRKTFAPGYKKCMMVAIHKKDRSDAYIVFLLDDEDDVKTEMAEAMFNLRFAE